MKRELVIIYDVPATTKKNIAGVHNPGFYLQWFDKVHITYWSKQKEPKQKEGQSLLRGEIAFYGYEKEYSSGYLAGVAYMAWIAKTLWKIASAAPSGTRMVFMPVIPIWAGIPALLVAKLRRERIVLRLEAEKISYTKLQEELRGSSRLAVFLKTFLLKAVYWITIPMYHAVLVLSEGMKKEVEMFGPKRVVLLPIPINLEPFFAARKAGTAKGGTVPPFGGRVLYVGQVKRVKGIDTLVGALALLQKEGARAKILVVGGATSHEDEEFFQELKGKARGLDIEFLGWVAHEKLPEVYGRADVFVLPSLSEAWGMVVAEAMASALPVVASNVSGPRDLVQHGETGFLAEPGNAEELAEKLTMLLQDARLREQMGAAGRVRIKEYMKGVEEANQTFWSTL